eukprot:706234-Prymnesium_polylepis.1
MPARLPATPASSVSFAAPPRRSAPRRVRDLAPSAQHATHVGSPQRQSFCCAGAAAGLWPTELRARPRRGRADELAPSESCWAGERTSPVSQRRVQGVFRLPAQSWPTLRPSSRRQSRGSCCDEPDGYVEMPVDSQETPSEMPREMCVERGRTQAGASWASWAFGCVEDSRARSL